MKIIFSMLLTLLAAQAHFLTLLPTSDHINQNNNNLTLDAMFIHPFEQTGMTMVKPEGIFVNKEKKSLPLQQTKQFDHKAWTTNYMVKRPGVYQFYTVPQPYFEPSEQKYIKHVPKTIVSAYGLEDGWNEPLGLKYEIIPMVKPFALNAGNLFQARVLRDGKPAANVEVEVELHNTFGLKAPTDAHITQVVTTDDNGIFSFVMNHKGWWGFAALFEEGQKDYNGKMYPIEHGALIWIKAY